MQYLIELIDDDHLNVSDEATVLLAVIIWCFARRRNDLLYNFLKVLRYPRIKYPVLTKLLYHPFVSSYEQSKELVSKFLSDYSKFKSKLIVIILMIILVLNFFQNLMATEKQLVCPLGVFVPEFPMKFCLQLEDGKMEFQQL